MPYNLECLVPGDIISDGGHSMMYVGRTDALGSPYGGYEFVHAYPMGGVCLVTSNGSPMWFDNSIYRCTEARLAAVAARYGKAWANNGNRTSYASLRDGGARMIPNIKQDTRTYGVTEEYKRYKAEEDATTGSGTLPPMEFDAFLRAVKWALRPDKAFSANRGTTCCAFVISCYHAAAVAICAENNQVKLQDAHSAVAARRLPKKVPTTEAEYATTPSGKKLSPLAFRTFSNAGGTLPEGQSFRTYAQTILSDLAGHAVTLEDVFTAEMLIDAKFIYSAMLAKQLSGTGGQWAKLNVKLGDPYA